MRKVTLLIGALALVLGISQCNKQDSPLQNGGKQHIVLTTGNDGSKVAVTASSVLNFKWEEGDVIKVSGGAKGTLHLTSAPGNSTATFEGDVEDVNGEPLVFSVGDEPTADTYMNQIGTKEALEEILNFETEKAYQENGNYGNVQLPLTFAVLNLDLSKFASSKSGEATVTFSEKDTKGEPIASVTGVNASSTAVLVALPTDASPQEKVYELSNGTVVDYMTCTLNPDVYYSGNDNGDPIQPDPQLIVPGGGDTPGGGGGDEPTIPAGALPGKFTINSDGDQVYFSQGNLWYNKTDDKFYFETNQWDYPGEWNESHLGYFVWSEKMSVAYTLPYSDPGVSTNDVLFTNVDGFKVNVEGDDMESWYTLTSKQWKYLKESRVNASKLCKFKTLNDGSNTVKGYVVLPDNSDEDGTTLNAISSLGDLGTYNAVFLPAAGQRKANSEEMQGVDSYCFYWLADSFTDAGEAYQLMYSSFFTQMNNVARSGCNAVRLVYDIPKSK